MIQCNVFRYIIFAYNIIILLFMVQLLLCYKTQSSSVINVYVCIDPLVPACLGLALFLTRPILSHPAG